MKQRMVVGSAEQVAEQIKTKVLDAGIDGVIINMPTNMQGYAPGRHHRRSAKALKRGPRRVKHASNVANLTLVCALRTGCGATTVDAVSNREVRSRSS